MAGGLRERVDQLTEDFGRLAVRIAALIAAAGFEKRTEANTPANRVEAHLHLIDPNGVGLPSPGLAAVQTPTHAPAPAERSTAAESAVGGAR